MTGSVTGCAGRPPRPVSHREEAFKLSSDPHFVEKVRDIIDLRKSPPDRAPVLSVGEKALVRAQSVLPKLPGIPERAHP